MLRHCIQIIFRVYNIHRNDRDRGRMVVGSVPITTILVSSTRSWQGVLGTTLCDEVCQVTCDRSVVFSGYSGFLYQ